MEKHHEARLSSDKHQLNLTRTTRPAAGPSARRQHYRRQTTTTDNRRQRAKTILAH